jgi:hypothetical protein
MDRPGAAWVMPDPAVLLLIVGLSAKEFTK